MLHKLKIIVISILLMAMFTTTCCFADASSPSVAISYGDELSPQYVVTRFIQSSLGFTGRQACVDIYSEVDRGAADRMKVTVTLKKVGSSTSVKTWTDQIRMVSDYGTVRFSEYYTVPSSGTYYFTAVGKMYRNNLVVDSFSVSSPQKVCS
ncbi:MAG: hypothetical protein HFE90_10550 [Firmicutes bacterium]|nr:hypothetical protein [Bacillota bacterium]